MDPVPAPLADAAAGEPATELNIEAGAIVALRLFDVAYAIDLAQAERLWGEQVRTPSSRSKLAATHAKAVAFGDPPVVLTMEAITLEIDGRTVRTAVSARLYDFGIVAFSLRVPVEGLPWSAYVQQVNALDALVGAKADPAIWTALLDRIRAVLSAALTRSTPSTMQEDYLLAIVHRWSEPVDAAGLQARVDLEGVLSGETRRLSESARHEVLRHRYSYYEDDLVVLTWDRAFLFEPRGETDVADVLEVANAQFLELRYYDEWLDDELPRMYDLVEQAGRTIPLLAPRRFARLARSLYALVAEVTEITEKVDNALQVTEDVYLARIYSAALRQFRVGSVSGAVERKLAIVRDTYTALYDEASSTRGSLMEAAIVILIVIEIALALIRH